MCFAKHIRLVKRRARITFAATLYIHVCASERVCRLAAQKREFCSLHSHQTTKRVRSERLRSQTVLHDASSHAMSSVWDDSDTDSSNEDDGPTLRQRRDKWRRLADRLRAEADDQWQRECGVPAGPRRRKQRAREVPGTRDKRFSHAFSWRDERARRFDHSRSPWWGLIRHPDVHDETSAAGTVVMHDGQCSRCTWSTASKALRGTWWHVVRHHGTLVCRPYLMSCARTCTPWACNGEGLRCTTPPHKTPHNA